MRLFLIAALIALIINGVTGTDKGGWFFVAYPVIHLIYLNLKPEDDRDNSSN